MKSNIEELNKLFMTQIYIKELCFENVINNDLQHVVNVNINFLNINELENKETKVNFYNVSTNILDYGPFYQPLHLSVQDIKDCGYETARYRVFESQENSFNILCDYFEIIK